LAATNTVDAQAASFLETTYGVFGAGAEGALLAGDGQALRQQSTLKVGDGGALRAKR
jgi:hypothetical protein